MVGLAYCGFGLSRLVGLDARLRREYDDPPDFESMTKEQLEQELETRPLPFFVCTRFRIAMEPGDCGGVCPECGSETDCLPVSDETDRKTVKAAIYSAASPKCDTRDVFGDATRMTHLEMRHA